MKHSDNKHANIRLRDGNTCWLCDRPFINERATLDHVLPRSRGGSNRLANLKLAHARCNTIRGNIVDPAASRYKVLCELGLYWRENVYLTTAGDGATHRIDLTTDERIALQKREE